MATAEQTLVMINRKSNRRRQEAATATSFEEVYRRYFRPLYAFIALRVGSRNAAEDVTAQVFEKALKAYPGYDPGRGGLSTWLFAIARNAVSDHFRRQRPDEVELDEGAAAAASADPLAELEAAELKANVRQALKVLEPREQELVALKFGAGLNNREIAGLLELSESNVGTILYRSLGKMKTRLEDGDQND